VRVRDDGAEINGCAQRSGVRKTKECERLQLCMQYWVLVGMKLVKELNWLEIFNFNFLN
jgi:hypothetical protein